MDFLVVPTATFRVLFVLVILTRERRRIAHFNVNTPMLGLLGGAGDALWAVDWYEKRVTDPQLVAAAYDVALSSGPTLFGCLLAGNDDLVRFGGTGPLNTDDRPRVVFDAPSLAYRKDEPGYRSLLALLDECSPTADNVIDVLSDLDKAADVNAYLAARNIFLRAMILLDQGRDEDGVMMLVNSVRTDPDFRTAYTTALKVAVDRKDSDPDRAHFLLTSLIEINPHDHRAQRFLNQLFPE